MELLDEKLDGEVPDKPVKPEAIRVVLADSQAIYLVGIRKILALEDDICLVAQADSLENLLVAIEQHPTDVVLVEGDLLTGAPASIQELQRIAPDVKLIVQTASISQDQTVEFYRCGIRGIISRSISPDLLLRCIRCIASGETWIDNQALTGSFKHIAHKLKCL
jgi:DNA-binding NarL/FixJ family response regulator